MARGGYREDVDATGLIILAVIGMIVTALLVAGGALDRPRRRRVVDAAPQAVAPPVERVVERPVERVVERPAERVVERSRIVER